MRARLNPEDPLIIALRRIAALSGELAVVSAEAITLIEGRRQIRESIEIAGPLWRDARGGRRDDARAFNRQAVVRPLLASRGWSPAAIASARRANADSIAAIWPGAAVSTG